MNGKIIRGLILAVLATAAVPLFGQLVVSLSFNRTRYMVHEHIFACVTIRNDSGKPLLFGDRPELQGFILFDIRDGRHVPLKRRAEREFSATGLYIAPGEIKRIVIPLHRYYDLSAPGDYTIHAYVSHNLVPKEYRSRDVEIRVMNGTPVWEKTVGLPVGDRDGKPVERRYSINKAQGDGVFNYYLKVEDNGQLFAVTRVGREIARMKFDAQVDMLSRLHLLMPVSPKVYHYMSFNSDGMNLESTYWKTSGTIPMLYRDPKSGRVTRMGGIAARKGVDYADPKSGNMTISDLMESNTPKAKADGGLVDLGSDLLPKKSGDED